MSWAGSLEHLGLEEGDTLLLRGATSSVGLACLELARAAGVRVIATTRSEAKGRRLTELGAVGIVLDGDGFAERAHAALPEGGADGAVDLIGGPAVLETLRLLRPGATACNSGSLSDTIDAVYTLEQTIDAHRRMAANEATGKLVVLPRA